MEVSFSLSCLLPSFLTYKRTHRHLLWCLDEEAPEGPPQTGFTPSRARAVTRDSPHQEGAALGGITLTRPITRACWPGGGGDEWVRRWGDAWRTCDQKRVHRRRRASTAQ